MVVVIDNYDSFTYNLVQRLGEIDPAVDVRVFRNDELTVAQLDELSPERLLISPGPCTPNEAGISVQCVRHFAGRIPLLGVCLGHQSIGQALGGQIVRRPRIDAWQNGRDSTRQPRLVRGGCQPVCGDSLPQFGDRTLQPARGSDCLGLDRHGRHTPNHGRPASPAPGRRLAVSPRELSDRTGHRIVEAILGVVERCCWRSVTIRVVGQELGRGPIHRGQPSMDSLACSR